jgi:hypothetical protein
MIISGVSGSLGEDYYARITKDGRTIISHKPDFSNRQFSEAQFNVQSRLQQAAAYAKVASKENPIYAEKAAGTSRNAYNLALRDWYKPPVIFRIQWNDGQVRVGAYDDGIVTRVTVSIRDENGQTLERGEAALNGWWEYHATARGNVCVEAWDLAGNVTRQEFCPGAQSFYIWGQPR